MESYSQTIFKKPLQPKAEKIPGDEIRRDTRSFLKNICKIFKDPQERTDQIIERVYLVHKNIDRNIFSNEQMVKIQRELSACVVFKKTNQFIDRVMKILEPIFDMEITHPFEFEEARAMAIDESAGYTRLNRLVTYEKVEDAIQLHHSVAKTVGPKLHLYYDAMRKLAKIVEDDPEIKVIEAASWIVANARGLFEKNGFHVNILEDRGAYSLSRNMKDNQDREVAYAYIDREEFLKRFLQ